MDSTLKVSDLVHFSAINFNSAYSDLFGIRFQRYPAGTPGLYSVPQFQMVAKKTPYFTNFHLPL